MAMASAPREPAVPGATGDKPQPNQVATSHGKSQRRRASGLAFIGVAVVFFFRIGGLDGRRDHVFFAGPVAEIDDLAALAAEGEELVFLGDLFLADGALHRVEARIGNGSLASGAEDSGESARRPTRS